MPEMTVKAFAELMHMPLYGQGRIIYEQKYPKQGAAPFRTKYYQPAINVIRRYYQRGNDVAVLPTSADSIPGITKAPGNPNNNLRAVHAFRASKQSIRQLRPQANPSLRSKLGNITLRATPDLLAIDSDNSTRHILYNLSELRPDEEIIRSTVELYHFVLGQNGSAVPLRCIEFVHLQEDELFRWTGKPRQRTIKRAETTAKLIAGMWDNI